MKHIEMKSSISQMSAKDADEINKKLEAFTSGCIMHIGMNMACGCPECNPVREDAHGEA